MRLSVIKGDKGRVITHSYEQYSVLLDGVEINNCLTADEDSGYILCAKLDSSGKVFLDGDEVATRELYGKVEIRRKK